MVGGHFYDIQYL